MWVVYVSLSWLPEENLSSFVTIMLWQKAWKEQVIQHFTWAFRAKHKCPMTCSQQLYWEAGCTIIELKVQRHIGLDELLGQVAIESKSPLLLLHCLAELLTKRFADLQKARRNSRSWGHKVTEIKKSVTFSFYLTQRKRLLKIFHHRFPSESSQPIYINEAAPVKEPARKRRKLSAQKIWAKIRVALARGGEI